MDKLYYTIGEVAEILGESVSLVRFWSDSFSKYVQPQRNAKGNRMYMETDIEFLKEVHYLVKDCGLTLEGAEKKLKTEGEAVAKRSKAVSTLKGIRAQLTEIRKSL
ncbi:MAG: MerR family transcriptional regulator [Bacteroidales bacterium]|nr:MerR family transcriptional regulator [Bacteroidales bacterium]